LLVAVSASAHSVAADLSVWGNFGNSAAYCQRSIARAAALCTGRTLAARTVCSAAQLRGAACDVADLDARMSAARSAPPRTWRRRARATICSNCATSI
jgi:hypothetical protein